MFLRYVSIEMFEWLRSTCREGSLNDRECMNHFIEQQLVNALLFRAVKLWNDLPDHIKSENNLRNVTFFETVLRICLFEQFIMTFSF